MVGAKQGLCGLVRVVSISFVSRDDAALFLGAGEGNLPRKFFSSGITQFETEWSRLDQNKMHHTIITLMYPERTVSNLRVGISVRAKKIKKMACLTGRLTD